jgi:hypothetical protein
VSYDRPRCEFCGKFLSDKDLDSHYEGSRDVIDGRLVWSGGPVPEPSHDEWWHVKCKDKHYEGVKNG